jgi:D-alanyl-lipoteichoic acid acyltransferase DltB (MBOAT superfamily)
LVDFALYVSFFPEIMAGPIDRANKLIPQFTKNGNFHYGRVTCGLKLIAWGFFKKLVIADRLAAFVDVVYRHPGQYDGLSLTIATIYFSFQIYCDFSGYTDIALGIGRVMGFELMENFNRPYFAKSIGDFWRRWHMSLSRWLMDYLFLPIAYGFSRKIKSSRLLTIKAESWAYGIGIICTMLVCGLWHGAEWNFVLWGGIHGLYLIISLASRRVRRYIRVKLRIKPNSLVRKILSVSSTFTAVTFAWIFFRANSTSDAIYIVTHLFSGWSKIFSLSGLIGTFHFGLSRRELVVALVSVLVMFLVHWRRREQSFEQLIGSQNLVLRWGIYLLLLAWILTFSESASQDFIYFRF